MVFVYRQVDGIAVDGGRAEIDKSLDVRVAGGVKEVEGA
jgi:hypothetical protein